jgi:hypothetical protein
MSGLDFRKDILFSSITFQEAIFNFKFFVCQIVAG